MKKLLILLLAVMMLPSVRGTEAEEESEKTNLVYLLRIFSNINSTSWIHTQKAFEEAEKLNADAILIHLNTYGGHVIFADSIRTKILNSTIPVHVFIDNNAASAGALISIACDSIYMRPGGNIGAATVVNQTGEEMPDKYQSYMRSTIRATAEAHGKDTIITATDTIIKWKRDPRIAEAMVDDRVSVPGVIDSGKVLTFTALEAIEHGFCEGTANSIGEVIKLLKLEPYELKTYQPSFYDSIKGFLTSPVLQSLLVLLIIGGLYFELQSPGVGFPLALAVLAAILYFAPLYIDGLAANWEILIFIIGLALIAIEIFAIPGFGITGISGIILTLTGLILSLVNNTDFDFSPVDTGAFLKAIVTVFSGIFGGFILSLWLSQKIFSKTKGPFAKLALQTSQPTNQGYVSVDTEINNLTGKEGKAVTVLRPSGRVEIDGKIYDARSSGEFIDKDEPVIVTDFSTAQVVVRKMDD
ncbi:NfeD family protein [Thermophagus xiamenensis]|uniref:Membrane-bound serine protease (ClpP class) n=1 Tax=Thermophagus xiamenensis TaxID=385682 RepID=A0A1I1W0S6_9BACT|nr:NfeD family protein [Thermophagus xiamenensis]SFD86510.1 membrane-bound serine protease (ClpP class) [Thermophagus xiamenensis]